MRHLLVGLVLALTLCSTAQATQVLLRLGPASLGNGGSNPLGIPPGAADIEGALVLDNGFETSIGLPGLLAGMRSRFASGAYVGLGGGLIIDANGAGIGGYSAFGIDFGETFIFNLEYKQALGISSAGVLSPYVLRFGLGFGF